MPYQGERNIIFVIVNVFFYIDFLFIFYVSSQYKKIILHLLVKLLN